MLCYSPTKAACREIASRLRWLLWLKDDCLKQVQVMQRITFMSSLRMWGRALVSGSCWARVDTLVISQGALAWENALRLPPLLETRSTVTSSNSFVEAHTTHCRAGGLPIRSRLLLKVLHTLPENAGGECSMEHIIPPYSLRSVFKVAWMFISVPNVGEEGYVCVLSTTGRQTTRISHRYVCVRSSPDDVSNKLTVVIRRAILNGVSQE